MKRRSFWKLAIAALSAGCFGKTPASAQAQHEQECGSILRDGYIGIDHKPGEPWEITFTVQGEGPKRCLAVSPDFLHIKKSLDRRVRFTNIKESTGPVTLAWPSIEQLTPISSNIGRIKGRHRWRPEILFENFPEQAFVLNQGETREFRLREHLGIRQVKDAPREPDDEDNFIRCFKLDHYPVRECPVPRYHVDVHIEC